MALLRVLHAADLPDPGKLAKKLEQLGQGGVVAANSPTPGATSEPGAQAAASPPAADAANADPYPKWEEFIGWLEQRGHMQLGAKLRMQAYPIEVGSGVLRYGLAKGFTENLERELRETLGKLAAQSWQVTQEEGEPGLSLLEREAATREIAAERIKADPLVAATLSAFPGAEIVSDEPANINDQAPPWSRNA